MTRTTSPAHQSGRLRTIDVALAAGCSTQQIRDLETAGILPVARRTSSGHRVYADVHVRCARAYRHLAAGTGPVEAKQLVRVAHAGPVAAALARVDAAHARLHRERADLRRAVAAVRAISDEEVGDVLPSDAMGVAELADALGVRSSTLRFWDHEGLVIPERITERGVRRYPPSAVREARIVHQLRQAGYRIDALRTLMPELRHGRSMPDLQAALAARDASITTRSRALLDGAAELSVVMT